MDHFVKVSSKFVTGLFLFYVCLFVCLFWPRGMWDISFPDQNQGWKQRPPHPTCPALEGKVLTAKPSGKSLSFLKDIYLFGCTRSSLRHMGSSFLSRR